jgi:HPt (histidine-containing phosphotransfer) domain-containing protein
LLRHLHALDDTATAGGGLAESTHALSGSAGMFGFKRLASDGLSFERAIRAGAAITHATAKGLITTLEITLREIGTGPTTCPISKSALG